MDFQTTQLVGDETRGVDGGLLGASVAPLTLRPVDSERRVVCVRHGHRGCPIEILITDPNERKTEIAVVSPLHALQLAMLLTEFAAKELAHR
jgi:hypothetical protein